jgi:hypothetical protein
MKAVGKHDVEPALSRRDCGRQSGGAAADNENVCAYHRSRTNSEQNPGPMAESRL